MGVLLALIGMIIGEVFITSWVAGLVIALIIWGIMTLVAYFQGDNILLSVAGAKKISPSDHQQLYDVVEEMKIASGLEKMPDIYIIDDPSLNAFATGRDPNHAAVSITSGLLQKLNRDELQGVIGHELSHIKHRDVLLMSMCSVLLGTIVILSYYASRMMMFGAIFGGGGSGGGGAQDVGAACDFEPGAISRAAPAEAHAGESDQSLLLQPSWARGCPGTRVDDCGGLLHAFG